MTGRFAASLEVSQRVAAGYRVWVNAELGLRHYLEDQGALPLRKTQQLRPGDLVVSSELEASLHPTGPLALLAKTEIDPAIPLRLIGVESHSGYSTVSRGFWPFGFTGGVIDRLRADDVRERRPTLEYLPMDAPEAGHKTVAVDHLLVHAEVAAAVRHQLIQFLKGAFVEKQLDTFARGELALFMLAVAAFRTAALFGRRVPAAEFLEPIHP